MTDYEISFENKKKRDFDGGDEANHANEILPKLPADIPEGPLAF
jgi:hypothetical protein